MRGLGMGGMCLSGVGDDCVYVYVQRMGGVG